MESFEPFTILPLDYFTSKNPFSGSRGGFNYKIVPDETFHVLVWYGKKCSAKSEKVAEVDFPLEEESRPLVCAWLDEQYRTYDAWRLERYFRGEE